MIRSGAVNGAFLAGIVLCGCFSGASDVGNARLAITLSPTTSVNRVDYRVSGNGITPRTGAIDVSRDGSVVTLLVTGIPAGNAYLLELNATATDRETVCGGEARFDILAAQTTRVPVVLLCVARQRTGSVVVNGRLDNCPTLTSVIASPLQTEIGGVVSLAAAGIDLDNDPIDFVWTATGGLGAFASPASANTTFTCTSAGATTLSVAVSDGVCGAVQPIMVNCGPPACAIDNTYTFSISYGLVFRTEVGILSPPDTFRFTKPGVGTCAPALPACGTATARDIGDIVADIADADVQATFAQAVSPIYGARNVADAMLFDLRRSDGRGFQIVLGFECATPSAQCVPTPAGVRRFVEDLQALASLGTLDPSCGSPPSRLATP